VSKESEKPIDALLTKLGFVSESRQTWVLWRLRSESLVDPKEVPESLQNKPASSRVVNPWRVLGSELASRKSGLAVHNLMMDLDKTAILRNLSNLTKKYFGARTTSDFVFQKDGSIWCLFEFNRALRRDQGTQGDDVSRQLSKHTNGVGGFKVRILAEGTEGQLVLSDIFGFGFLPFVFVTVPLRFLAEALGLRSWGEISHKECVPTSIHEMRFPLMAPVLVHLASLGATPAMLRKLEAELSQARGQFSPSVFAGDEGLSVRLLSDDMEIPAGFTEVTFVPVEVLESRERLEQCRDLDKAITTGKLNQAWKQLVDRCATERDTLYLWRRLSLLGLVGCGELNDDAIMGRALDLEPNQKLFLSYSIHLALLSKNQSASLEHLSKLGALLMSEIRGADNLQCFDLVLPELLGDVWAQENHDKAADCYYRVLEKRGDVPRVLKKLIELARLDNRIDAEISLLHRLIGAERRRIELAKIHLRLAELRRLQGISGDDAIQLAQKALKLDRGLVAAALLIADILVERERYEEAIQVSDSLLKDRNLNLSAAEKRCLEATIGRIWCHHLHRPDLAATRYEMAIEYDVSDLETLRELEHIYRQGANHLSLARILEAEFAVFEQNGKSEYLKPIFDELVSLYRGSVREPKRALELYLRLLATSTIATQELDLLFSWNDVDIDWSDLSARLIAKIPAVQSGRRRGEFLCRLAEVFRDRLGDDVGAIRHLRAANQEGWIDASGFAFLTEYLSQQKDYRSLVQAFELRLQQVSPADQQSLILELLTTPAELTDLQRDNLALRVYAFDLSADIALKKRFQVYHQANQVDAIGRLMAAIGELKKLTSMQRLQWMREAIQSLFDLDNVRRYELMGSIYSQMLPIVDDQTIVLNEAVSALKESPDLKYLLFFVRELLKRGLTAELAERDIIKLLRGLDQELAIYHELMSFKATTIHVAVSHARTAAALYAKRLNQEVATEKMVARVCTLVACTPDELQELRILVERTGHWKLLAKALQKQAEFEENRQQKFALLDQLGQIFWHKMKDRARARLAFSASARFSDEPHKIHHVLAKLAAETNDVEREKQHLGEYLQDVASTVDIETLTRNAERLLKIGEDPVAVQRILQKHVDKSFSKGRWQQAGQLAGALINNGLVSSEIYKVTLKAAIVELDAEKVVDQWWRGLACVANKSKMKAYLSETTILIERGEMRHVLLDCYKAALDHNIGDRIGPTSKQELMLVYASMLFDQDETRRKALAIYSEVYAADPSNSRTWMPLYFLLLEFGAPTERLTHLRAILPKLRLDQRPLKSFPLTIESMQLELRNLEKEILVHGATALPRTPVKSAEKSIDLAKKEESSLRPDSDNGVPQEISAPAIDIGLAVSAGLQDVDFTSKEESANVDLKAVSGDFAGFVVPNIARDSSLVEPSPVGIFAPVPKSFSGGEVVEFKLDIADEVPPSSGSMGGSDILRLDLEPAGGLDLSVEDRADVQHEDAASTVAPKGQILSTKKVSKDDNPFAANVIDLDSEDIDDVEDSAESSMNLGGDEILQVGLSSNGQLNGKTGPSADVMEFNLGADVLSGLSPRAVPPIVVAGFSADLSEETTTQALTLGNMIFPPAPGVIIPPIPPIKTALDSGDGADGTMLMNQSTSFEVADGNESTDRNVIDTVQVDNTLREGFGVNVDAADDAADWRAAVIKGDFNADLTGRLLQQAFASEIEKHLAIQSVALVAGNCERLSNWHWRVWRNPDEYGYPLSGKERFPQRLNTPGLNSSLHKLVIAMAPLLVRINSSRFSQTYLNKKLNLTESMIQQMRKPLDWQSGILRTVGLHHYAERVRVAKYTAYDLPGLGAEIFYDGLRRTLYVDSSHYRKTPSSHLFHRIIGLIWSVRIHYYVPLALDPVRDFLPVIGSLHQIFSKQGFSKLKMKLSSSDGINKYLRDFDLRPVRAIHEKIGMPSEDQVLQLWESMRAHIYRMQIAETLDVIGLFESILDKDLLVPNLHKHSEIYQRSPYAKALIEFVTKLNI
jgi:hypothetical protein